MPTHLRIYLPLLFLLKFTFSSAQQYHFKNYTVDNGLPFVQVFCMIQDQKGYLWSGGYGGLSRFDGKEFLNFSPKNGLINHYVNAICEGDSGTIYVATIEGLSVLKNNKPFASYNSNNGLPEKNITCAFYTKEGLLLGTKKGLCKFSSGKFSTIKAFDSLEVKCLLKISDNTIAVGTARGLYYYELNSGTLKKQTGLDNNNINCLSRVPDTGDLYAGTMNGLSKIPAPGENKSPFNFHIINGLIDENISTVLCENKNSIWVGTVNGLLNFNGNQFSFYKIYSDNNANHIRCIIKDSENNIWIGTHAGLFRYRDNAFSSFDKETGIGNAFVFQILRDKKGDLWFGTESNGLYKYSQGFFKNYTTKDGLPSNFCPAIFEDDDGTLWIGTDNGISKFKNGSFSNFTQQQGFAIKGVLNTIYKDKLGNIWTGGQNGAACFKKTGGGYTPTYFYLPSSLTEYGVEAFAEDKNGTLWMGTFGNGLFRMENNKFVKQNERLHLKASDFFMLICENNILYGATLNGVWIYDLNTNKQNFISEKDGLNSELIYLIHLSKKDNVLWIGTNQGINKMDLKKYLENGEVKITSYGKAEGFTGVECNNYGVWEDADGTMWFGTVSGVVKYEPKAFKVNKEESRTYFHSITLQNADTALKSGVVLPYNYNNIGFYYRGISLTNPDKVKYIKKLEGLENSWSEPSTEDYSKYANLPAGSYTFQVKSCNSEGIWQLETAQFAFEIRTAFFKTWWFYALITLGVSATIFLIFRIRLQRIRKKEQIEFETQVAISKVELKALRAQMNPHFVFNSLNSIQHYILYNKSEEAAKYLNKFAKLIRIILNNSEKAMVTVNEDIESLKLYLELESMRFDGKFDYTVNIDKSIDPDYDEIPPMLMQPYLENAILHGLTPKKEKGHLKIDIFTKDNYIVCRIVDDGIGRTKAGEIKRTTPGAQHKSLGMKITSERVRILNAINKSDLSFTITDLKDEHQESCGTMVELYIPHIK